MKGPAKKSDTNNIPRPPIRRRLRQAFCDREEPHPPPGGSPRTASSRAKGAPQHAQYAPPPNKTRLNHTLTVFFKDPLISPTPNAMRLPVLLNKMFYRDNEKWTESLLPRGVRGLTEMLNSLCVSVKPLSNKPSADR